jgi:hypothetical protein
VITRFIWTFKLRSYNYWLHNLAPLKPKTLSSLSSNLAPGFFLVIISSVVFCLSAVSRYLSSSDIALFCICRRILYCARSVLARRRILTRLVLSSLVDESCIVLVLSCLVDESSLVLQSSSNPLKVALRVPYRGHLVEQFIFLAVIHTTLFLLREQMVYLAVDWQWTSILNAWGTCLPRVAQQVTVPASFHINVSTIRYLVIDIAVCSGFAGHNNVFS